MSSVFYTTYSNGADWQDSEGNRFHKLTINARREILLEVGGELLGHRAGLGEAGRTQDLMQDLENADELQENIERIINLWRKG